MCPEEWFVTLFGPCAMWPSHFSETFPANWDMTFFHKIDLYWQLLMIGAKLDELPPPGPEIREVDLLSLEALNMLADISNMP